VINAFVANRDDLKQMPFQFVLMSSWSAPDYKAVFEYLKTHILDRHGARGAGDGFGF
jgi:hypothetical protein